ncbi:MAG: hypothetical protein OSP8Acid_04260 [uncultured Acidilobus sp. OSP8]|nr:MAG: hypothetical protein OSP8Acid_04260 [uncultured Acidilobus sp. OSP8]
MRTQMLSEEYYELAWRAVRKGFGEIDYILRQLNATPKDFEAGCHRIVSTEGLTEHNVATLFSCVVIALLTSLSSQLTSLLTELVARPDLCRGLEGPLRELKALSESFRRDLLEEGAQYKVLGSKLLRTALSLSDITGRLTELAKDICETKLS